MLNPNERSILRGEIKLIRDELDLILRRLDYMDAQLQEMETVELPTYPYINPVVTVYSCPPIDELNPHLFSYLNGGHVDEEKKD